MTRVPAIGERFELQEEDVFGIVDMIVDDEFGDPASLVIACDDGKWAAVPLDAIVWRPATVH